MTSSRTNDQRARDAVETIISELTNQQDLIDYFDNKVRNLELTVEDKEIELDRAMQDIEELTGRIKELEDALAEAHLTGHTCRICSGE